MLKCSNFILLFLICYNKQFMSCPNRSVCNLLVAAVDFPRACLTSLTTSWADWHDVTLRLEFSSLRTMSVHAFADKTVNRCLTNFSHDVQAFTVCMLGNEHECGQQYDVCLAITWRKIAMPTIDGALNVCRAP